MLGLVANNNVIVADNIAGATNRTIQASIFARTGSFTAENYATRSIDGELRVLGSIVQNSAGRRRDIHLASGTLQSGFYKTIQIRRPARQSRTSSALLSGVPPEDLHDR